MYCYIYDSFIHKDKKLTRIVSNIERRFSNLGIQGKTIKLTRFKNIEESLLYYIEEGIKNIVLIGGDATFNTLVQLAPKYDIVIGYVPLEENSSVAKLLGMPFGVAACDIISSRIIERVPLGKIGNSYFFSQVHCKAEGLKVIVDGNYVITPEEGSDVYIANFMYSNDMPTKRLKEINRCKELKVVVYPRKKKMFGQDKPDISKQSVLFGKNIKVESEHMCPITSENNRKFKAPITITSESDESLKVIVSKKRLFTVKGR